MSNDKMVRIGDVIEALKELEGHEVPDLSDADVVGEAIKEHGHTLYDMSVDLDDVANWDQIAEEIDLGKVMANHSCSDIVKEACDWHGFRDVLEELGEHTDWAEWKAFLFREYSGLSDESKDEFCKEFGYIREDTLEARTAPKSAKEGIDALTVQFGQYKVLGEFSLQAIKDYLQDMHGLSMDDIPEPSMPNTTIIGDLEWKNDHAPKVLTTWGDARDYALEHHDEGWRLPTVAELVALWDYDAGNCPHFDDPEVYWSSSPVKHESSRAWGVDFTTGTTLNLHTDDKHRVRLVRAVKA